jgi:hypothetical protein
MAISTLTTVAREQSTYVVTCAFTDETGAAVTPDTLYWTLRNAYGQVVNGRSSVEVTTPSTSNNIVLQDKDLSVPAGATESVLELIVFGTYTGVEGSGLPLRDACLINVDGIRP